MTERITTTNTKEYIEIYVSREFDMNRVGNPETVCYASPPNGRTDVPDKRLKLAQ
jgi:hypothetical protein